MKAPQQSAKNEWNLDEIIGLYSASSAKCEKAESARVNDSNDKVNGNGKCEWEFHELLALHSAKYAGDFESVKFALDSGVCLTRKLSIYFVRKGNLRV